MDRSSLSQRKQQQARRLVGDLRRNLSDLVDLRQAAGKATADAAPPPGAADDGLDIPDYLDRTKQGAAT